MTLAPSIVDECVEIVRTGGAECVVIPEVSIGEGFWSDCRAFERSLYSNDDEIEAASDFLQLDVAFGVVDVVRTEFMGFRFLAIARGERVDFAAPSVGKLQRHVAQPADANNSYPRGRRKGMLKQRRKDGDATTKERPRGRRIKRIGQWTGPRPLDAHPIREGAGAAHNSALTARTQMVISREALVT